MWHRIYRIENLIKHFNLLFTSATHHFFVIGDNNRKKSQINKLNRLRKSKMRGNDV